MATSKKQINEGVRKDYMEKVRAFLAEQGEEILITASNELTMPWADAEGNEGYIVLTFKVPTGSRDGTAYDGHAEAKNYAYDLEEKAKKAEAAAKKKAAKIAKDKAAREAKKAETEG